VSVPEASEVEIDMLVDTFAFGEVKGEPRE